MAPYKRISPISEKKRNSIIKQASRLFLKNGFGSISMDEISTAANVSKRTLYKNFPTKKTLFREIVKMEWKKVTVPQIQDARDCDPEELFTKIMKHLMKTMYSPRMQDLLRLVIAESSKFPELKSLQAKYGLEPLFNDFTTYIEHLCKTGTLEVDEPRIAAAQYIGLVKECLYWPWFFGITSKPSEKRQEDIIRRANRIFFGYYRTGTLSKNG